MILYMLRDGLPDGVVARIMGWSIDRVVAARRQRRRVLDRKQMDRKNWHNRCRRAVETARLWEEKRA